MSIATTTHLNFRGDASAALDFYQSVFGGEVMTFTYQDAGSVSDPAEADQIMWGQVTADNGFHVMAYDVPATRPFERGNGSFFVSVRGESAAEISALWADLSKDATVIHDLGPTGWAPLYGMLTDRFGVTWVLDVAAGHEGP